MNTRTIDFGKVSNDDILLEASVSLRKHPVTAPAFEITAWQDLQRRLYGICMAMLMHHDAPVDDQTRRQPFRRRLADDQHPASLYADATAPLLRPFLDSTSGYKQSGDSDGTRTSFLLRQVVVFDRCGDGFRLQ